MHRKEAWGKILIHNIMVVVTEEVDEELNAGGQSGVTESSRVTLITVYDMHPSPAELFG